MGEHTLDLDDIETAVRAGKVLAGEAALELIQRARGRQGFTFLQDHALRLVDERWPGDDMARRGLALCEESGEVARCILKADSNHAGYRTDTDWADQLRIELGQVAFVLATIAAAAGVDLDRAFLDAYSDVLAKPTAAARRATLRAVPEAEQYPLCGHPANELGQ